MYDYKKDLKLLYESKYEDIRKLCCDSIDDYIKQLQMELDFYRKESERINKKMIEEFEKHIPSIDNYPEDDLPF